MTDNVRDVLVAAFICSTVLTIGVSLVVGVNADTLVRAWRRWQGEFPKDPCRRCGGSGHEEL